MQKLFNSLQSMNDNENKNAVNIARLEATLEAHVRDFREFKTETMEYHRTQENNSREMNKLINNLTNEIRVFAGQMGGMATMQTQINEAHNRAEVLENELKDVKWWLQIFRYVSGVLTAVVSTLAYMVISNWWSKHF